MSQTARDQRPVQRVDRASDKELAEIPSSDGMRGRERDHKYAVTARYLLLIGLKLAGDCGKRRETSDMTDMYLVTCSGFFAPCTYTFNQHGSCA